MPTILHLIRLDSAEHCLISSPQELFLTLQGLVGAHYTEAQLEQVRGEGGRGGA